MACPGVRTIGRLIADAPDKMRITPAGLAPKRKVKPRRHNRKQRPGKGFHADYPGHCVAFDTVIRFIGRTRRYIFTATDHASRFSFAMAATCHDSQRAVHFATLVETVFPGRIEQVLSDNGSEFQGAFSDYAKARGWRHCHTDQRSPKMDAFNERFNRTVQEEWMDYGEDLLPGNVREFNARLPGCLDRYNNRRPHRGLDNLTPSQMLAKHLPPDVPYVVASYTQLE